MAKKKKTKVAQIEEQKDNQTKTETESSIGEEQVVVEESAPPEIEFVSEPQQKVTTEQAITPVVSTKTEPVYVLEVAAEMLISGFKDHWLPGIKVRGTLMGISPYSEQSLGVWRNLFIAWGGSGILKK